MLVTLDRLHFPLYDFKSFLGSHPIMTFLVIRTRLNQASTSIGIKRIIQKQFGELPYIARL